MSNETSTFDNLPKYDPTKFEAPAWARGPAFDYTRKNGESSKSAHSSTANRLDDPGSHLNTGEESDEEEDVWEDAQDDLEAGVEESPDGIVFTVAELRVGSLSFSSTSISRRPDKSETRGPRPDTQK